MSDEKKTEPKELHSFADLFDKLDKKVQETIWADFEKWRKETQSEYAVQFNVKKSKVDMDRDQAVTFFKSAFIFWAKKRPTLPKTGGVEILMLMKTRECNGNIDRLKKQVEATDIEIEELNLDEFL